MRQRRPKCDDLQTDARTGRRALNAILFGLATAAMLALAGPSLAQEDGVAAWKRGGCADCHGKLAQGGGGGENPVGPNLRRTRLERDLLWETAACGRPGTEMPFNLDGAYRETACFGLPLSDPPAEVSGGARLTAEQLDALVDFLYAYVVGVTQITGEACSVFYGGNLDHRECAEFPR